MLQNMLIHIENFISLADLPTIYIFCIRIVMEVMQAVFLIVMMTMLQKFQRRISILVSHLELYFLF